MLQRMTLVLNVTNCRGNRHEWWMVLHLEVPELALRSAHTRAHVVGTWRGDMFWDMAWENVVGTWSGEMLWRHVGACFIDSFCRVTWPFSVGLHSCCVKQGEMNSIFNISPCALLFLCVCRLVYCSSNLRLICIHRVPTFTLKGLSHGILSYVEHRKK